MPRERGAGEIKHLRPMTMQQGTSARRSGRNWNAVGGRRHGIALVTAVLILALPFTAQGQTSGATGGPANAGTAPVGGAAPSTVGQSTQAPASGVAAPAAAPSPAASASAAMPGD